MERLKWFLGLIAEVAPYVLFRNDSSPPCEHYGSAEQEEHAHTILTARALNRFVVLCCYPVRKLRPCLAYLVVALIPIVVYLPSCASGTEGLTTEALWQASFLFLISYAALLCVNTGYEELRDNTPSLVRLISSASACQKMVRVLRLCFSARCQGVFTFIGCVYVAGLLLTLGVRPVSLESCALMLCWMWVFGFLYGNGFYWALMTPQYVYLMASSPDITYDPFSPADTPGIRAMSAMLGTYALMNTIVLVTTYVLFKRLHFPGGMFSSTSIAKFHLYVGTIVVGYSFVYPQVVLVRLVRNLRAHAENTLLEAQAALMRTGDYTSERLAAIHSLLDRLRASKASPVAARIVGKYVASASIALVTLFKLEDLGALLSQLNPFR